MASHRLAVRVTHPEGHTPAGGQPHSRPGPIVPPWVSPGASLLAGIGEMASSWEEGASEEKAGLKGARKAAQSVECPAPTWGQCARQPEAGVRNPVSVAIPAPRIQSRSRPR